MAKIMQLGWIVRVGRMARGQGFPGGGVVRVGKIAWVVRIARVARITLQARIAWVARISWMARMVRVTRMRWPPSAYGWLELSRWQKRAGGHLCDPGHPSTPVPQSQKVANLARGRNRTPAPLPPSSQLAKI